MTVLTHPSTGGEKPAPKSDDEAKLVTDFVEHTYQSNSLIPFELYVARRRRRLLIWLAILLLSLWLLVVGFLSSILLYRYMNRTTVMYGWCGVDVEVEGRHERLQQRVEFAIGHGEFEKVEVPRFGFNRPATFTHDIRKNLTAIVDSVDSRCFVKDLGKVAPPKLLDELFRAMRAGYYEADALFIHEHFTTILPPLTWHELSDLGSVIEEQCSTKATYRLRRIPSRGRRNVRRCRDENFAEFVPREGLFNFHIHPICRNETK